MCIDRRGMRSLTAHKGWATRRARAALKPLALDPPIEGGFYSRAERERGKTARDLERIDALELAGQLVIEWIEEAEERLQQVLQLLEDAELDR